MDFWTGNMWWPIQDDWSCPTCGGRHGLTWGLAHGICRCNACHTQFSMRAHDEERTILTLPECLLKPEYMEPAKTAWAEHSTPVDELTDEQWDAAGAPTNA